MALTLINKLYGIERDMEEAGDAQRYQTRQSQSQAFLEGDGRENGQNRTLSMRPVRLRP